MKAREAKEPCTSWNVGMLLKQKKIKCGLCGRIIEPGNPISPTLIVWTASKHIIKTFCHDCYL